MNKRLSGRWSMQAGGSHTWLHDLPITVSEQPESRRPKQDQTRWDFKLSGNYERPGAFRISPLIRHQAGANFARTITVGAAAATAAGAHLQWHHRRRAAERAAARQHHRVRRPRRAGFTLGARHAPARLLRSVQHHEQQLGRDAHRVDRDERSCVRPRCSRREPLGSAHASRGRAGQLGPVGRVRRVGQVRAADAASPVSTVLLARALTHLPATPTCPTRPTCPNRTCPTAQQNVTNCLDHPPLLAVDSPLSVRFRHETVVDRPVMTGGVVLFFCGVAGLGGAAFCAVVTHRTGGWTMKRCFFGLAIVATTIAMAAPAFAQGGGASSHGHHSGARHRRAGRGAARRHGDGYQPITARHAEHGDVRDWQLPVSGGTSGRLPCHLRTYRVQHRQA